MVALLFDAVVPSEIASLEEGLCAIEDAASGGGRFRDNLFLRLKARFVVGVDSFLTSSLGFTSAFGSGFSLPACFGVKLEWFIRSSLGVSPNLGL
mmetsp:Transcript_24784/g.40357  ORF Transcript_24784/g.40357 Transcript_24784/m.40357 type:complete len:95 (-) Transcript_24784:305-589(-)